MEEQEKIIEKTSEFSPEKTAKEAKKPGLQQIRQDQFDTLIEKYYGNSTKPDPTLMQKYGEYWQNQEFNLKKVLIDNGFNPKLYRLDLKGIDTRFIEDFEGIKKSQVKVHSKSKRKADGAHLDGCYSSNKKRDKEKANTEYKQLSVNFWTGKNQQKTQKDQKELKDLKTEQNKIIERFRSYQLIVDQENTQPGVKLSNVKKYLSQNLVVDIKKTKDFEALKTYLQEAKAKVEKFDSVRDHEAARQIGLATRIFDVAIGNLNNGQALSTETRIDYTP
ncbi:MAG: hypothetical protein QM752_00185 [Gammaproteobacteria bacterium]